MQFACMYGFVHVKRGNNWAQFVTTSGQPPSAPGLLHTPHVLGHLSSAAAAVCGFVHKSGEVVKGVQSAPAAKI